MDLAYKFILLATSIACVSSVEFCEPITIETCSSAGYGSTARFPDVDGQPYQDVQASRLNIYIPLLTSCSKFASTILCSLYVPKCEESQRKPLVPCRKVCTNFVGECLDTLRIAGLAGMFTALCDLLPDENILSKNCFYPWKFNDTSSQGGISIILLKLFTLQSYKLCSKSCTGALCGFTKYVLCLPMCIIPCPPPITRWGTFAPYL